MAQARGTARGKMPRNKITARKLRKPQAKLETGKRAAPRVSARGPAWSGGADGIELFVYGITLGSRTRRPVLLLKDAHDQHALPVWLNPVDASYALSDFSHHAYAAHSAVLKMMEMLGIRLERCVFFELRGHHQYVRLYFSGHAKLREMEMRADEAMSLCLALGTRFFASQVFMAQCRDVDVAMMNVDLGVQEQPEIVSKSHHYMM